MLVKMETGGGGGSSVFSNVKYYIKDGVLLENGTIAKTPTASNPTVTQQSEYVNMQTANSTGYNAGYFYLPQNDMIGKNAILACELQNIERTYDYSYIGIGILNASGGLTTTYGYTLFKNGGQLWYATGFENLQADTQVGVCFFRASINVKNLYLMY